MASAGGAIRRRHTTHYCPPCTVQSVHSRIAARHVHYTARHHRLPAYAKSGLTNRFIRFGRHSYVLAPEDASVKGAHGIKTPTPIPDISESIDDYRRGGKSAIGPE